MKKNVLFAVVNDWANSGYKMCEAINRYSKKYHVDYFAVNEHSFGYYRGDNVVTTGGQPVMDRLQECHKKADIIHFKENEGVLLNIKKEPNKVVFDLDKPVVVTFGGSVFRKHHVEIWENNKQYVDAATVTTPDLLFDGIDSTLLPFAFDTDKYKPIEKSNDMIIIGHMPSISTKKGTSEIMPVIDAIKGTHNHTDALYVTQGYHYTIMELKRLCHVYIDALCNVYAYGNSAVESMALGSAVLTNHSYGADQPIAASTPEILEYQLNKLVSDREYLYQMQHESRKWAVDHHSYKVISNKLEAIYDGVSA